MEKKVVNNVNNIQSDENFNFDNILNSQKINELFGLNEPENHNNENNQLSKGNIFNDKLGEDKTNDNSYFNEEFNYSNNNYKNEKNFQQKSIENNKNNNIKSELDFKINEENENSNKIKDDFFMDNDFQSLFNIFEN